MAAIDRNILRLGAYEMLFCREIPSRVAINEALELAKRYSTAQSSRFVNGILDRVLQSELQAQAEAIEATHPAHSRRRLAEQEAAAADPGIETPQRDDDADRTGATDATPAK